MSDWGVLFVAVGEQALVHAHESVGRLKAVMPTIHATLYSDRHSDNGSFDRISQFEPTSRDDYPTLLLDRIGRLQQFPYERNLYLDNDTYLCADVSDLFSLLTRFDIGVAHAPMRELYRLDDIPNGFPEFNCGVILFQRSAKVDNFFSEWRETYKRHIAAYREEAPMFHDQPAFREALFHSELRIATLTPEYNCRFGTLGFLGDRVRILHGDPAISSSLGKLLNSRVAQRVHFIDKGDLWLIAREPGADWRLVHERYPVAGKQANLVDKLIRQLRRIGAPVLGR